MGIAMSAKKGCWIKYQLNLNSITYATVAKEANRSTQMVSDFIKGYKNSPAVQMALCKLLGYESFDKLISASRGHIGGDE